MISLSLSSPLSSNCVQCGTLVTDIRQQIRAFKILASVSTNLSWTILVQNLEELLIKTEAAGDHSKTEIEVQNPVLKSASSVTAAIIKQEDGQMYDANDDRQNFEVPDSPRDDDEDDSNSDDSIDSDFAQIQKSLNMGSSSGLTTEKLKQADEHLKRTFKNNRVRFQCLICKRYLLHPRDARLHVRRIHYKDRYKCPKCPKQFYDHKEMGQHRASCEGLSKKERLIWKKKVIEKEMFLRMKERNELKFKSNKVERNLGMNEMKKRGKGKINQSKRNIKKHESIDPDKIVVRNPFDNFNLKHALTAHVSLARIILPPSLISRGKKLVVGKGGGRRKFSRKLKYTNKPTKKQQQQAARENQQQKSSVLLSVFGKSKTTLKDNEDSSGNNNIKKLPIVSMTAAGGKKLGRPRKQQQKSMDGNTSFNHSDQILDHLPSAQLTLHPVDLESPFSSSSQMKHNDLIMDLRHGQQDVPNFAQPIGMNDGTTTTAAAGGNFLTNFDYDSSHYRDFPDVILNQLAAGSSHSEEGDDDASLQEEEEVEMNFAEKKIPVIHALPLQKTNGPTMSSVDQPMEEDSGPLIPNVYLPPSTTSSATLIPLTPVKVITSSSGGNKNTTSVGESAEQDQEILDLDIVKGQGSLSSISFVSNAPPQQQDGAGTKVSLTEVDSKILKPGNSKSSGTFKCVVCLKVYGNVTMARRHVRQVHFGERYKCSNCSKNFYNSTRKRAHEETCSGEEVVV